MPGRVPGKKGLLGGLLGAVLFLCFSIETAALSTAPSSPPSSPPFPGTLPGTSGDLGFLSPVVAGGRDSYSRIGIPWAWEKESRGQKPKSLQKVSKKSPRGLPAPGSQKCLQKGAKSLQKVWKWVFGDFSDLFRDFFRTFGTPGPGGAGRLFRDFLETFWLLAPRLLLPGPRNPNSRMPDASPFGQKKSFRMSRNTGKKKNLGEEDKDEKKMN